MSSEHRVSTSAPRYEGESISAAFRRLYRKLSPPRTIKEDHQGPKYVTPCAPRTSGPFDAGNDNMDYRSNTGGDLLQKVFAYFDINGDGKISPTELQTCVRTIGGDLSSEEAEAAIVSSDVDGDGLLSFEDFLRLMYQESTTDMEELRQAFQMYETKPGSGCISPSSLNRMLGRLGDPRSLDECKAMIRPFDLNGDGLLNFHEFSLMMH